MCSVCKNSHIISNAAHHSTPRPAIPAVCHHFTDDKPLTIALGLTHFHIEVVL
jgi:hypothetical protein